MDKNRAIMSLVTKFTYGESVFNLQIIDQNKSTINNEPPFPYISFIWSQNSFASGMEIHWQIQNFQYKWSPARWERKPFAKFIIPLLCVIGRSSSSLFLDIINSLFNNTISQTAMGMSPQQIRNTNVSDQGFLKDFY